MDLTTILVGAVVGVITSAITTYVTTLLKMKEEKEKWSKDFALKYAEKQTTDIASAQRMAKQFAMGVLIYENPETAERENFFLPSNCCLTLGRCPRNSIVIQDIQISRQHCLFNADGKNVYLLDLDSANATYVNGIRVKSKHKLCNGDVISFGKSELKFHQLDGNRR